MPWPEPERPKKGDVLAEINAPALDAQYAQAKADVETERAKNVLAELTAKRYVAMRQHQAVSEQAISVQVQDSGPGIEPELATRIFEPFFTTKSEGIGMGLSISYSIIESHGGQLLLIASNEGALFEFILPGTMNE